MARFSPQQALLIIFAFCFPIILVRIVQFQGEGMTSSSHSSHNQVVDHLPANTVEVRLLETHVNEHTTVAPAVEKEDTIAKPTEAALAETLSSGVAKRGTSVKSPSGGHTYTAGGWNPDEQPTPGEWPSKKTQVLSKLVQGADSRKAGPIEVSGTMGCASMASNVVVDVQQGVFFTGYSGKQNLPTCSIAGVKPIGYLYPGRGDALGARLEAKAKVGRGGECQPLGIISQIERPQHAAHMMWSMMSIISLQVEAGVDYTTTPVHLTMMTYGIFHTYAKDYKNLAKFPHIELLQLLSKKHVSLYVDQNYKRVMISPTAEDTAETGPQAGEGTSCFKNALIGNIPLRVPRFKNAKYETKPSHFQELRRRIISHFDLQVLSLEEVEANPVMLLISRVKQKRRLILNKDQLADKVRAMGITVKEVDWEGMSLKDQLQLAINARGMLGTHGNGMAWAPFMPLGSAMLEIGSTWSKRNEVIVGKNEENSANVARWSGLNALSIRCAYTENDFSKKTSPTRVWKEVDVTISDKQFDQIEEFLQPFVPKKKN